MRFLLLSLLILSSAAVGGTRVTPNTGSNMSILTSSNTGYLSGTNYWKQGDTVTSYIERLGRHTPVGVIPSRGVPTSRIAGAAKDLLRLTPGAVATSLAMMAVVETAGWAIDELTGQITKQDQHVISDPAYSLWAVSNGASPGPSPAFVCQSYVHESFPGVSTSVTIQNSTSALCYQQGSVFVNLKRIGSCPSGYSLDPTSGSCVMPGVDVPVTPSEIDELQITGDASFYDELMRDACNLSISPARCFDGLVEQRQLSGPATVQGPKTTTTSTQTNADGSTSTVEKEVSTQYEIQYGDDHYVYSPKTTTNTKIDGDVVDTVVEKEDTAEDSEQKPEEEEAE